MSPHPTTLLPPSSDKATEERQEHRARGSKTPIVSLPDSTRGDAVAHHHELFAETLLEMSPTRPRHRTLDIVVSLVFHFILLTTLVLIPLFFTEAIDLKQFTQMMLVAPPPPPPPPPPAVVARVVTPPKRVFTQAGKLIAPTSIPAKIAMLKEEALPPDVGAGVVGGVPGGVPGGQLGGVMGGIISNAPSTNIPLMPPSIAMPKAPVRVGGRIREPRLITRVDPTYPALARQARMQGDVLIDAVIGEDGTVQEMKIISGHPLLIPAALEALKKWRYQPTYLNDEPIPVQLLVTVRFRLQ